MEKFFNFLWFAFVFSVPFLFGVLVGGQFSPMAMQTSMWADAVDDSRISELKCLRDLKLMELKYLEATK